MLYIVQTSLGTLCTDALPQMQITFQHIKSPLFFWKDNKCPWPLECEEQSKAELRPCPGDSLCSLHLICHSKWAIGMNLRFNLNWCVNRRCRWSWRLTELSAERFFSTKTLGRQTWSGWIGQFQRDLLPRMDFYMQAYNIGRLHFHTLLYSWVNEASEFQHLLTHHEECVARAMALCEGNFMKQTANSLLANIGGKCG